MEDDHTPQKQPSFGDTPFPLDVGMFSIMCEEKRQQDADKLRNRAMTSLDIDAIEVRANAATPGPWTAYIDANEVAVKGRRDLSIAKGILRGPNDSQHEGFQGIRDNANRDLIAAARTDIPALCAEVRRLREQLENALARESAERAERIAAEEARDYAEAACANSWECGKCKEAGQ
jgi:hypothetical protein